MAPCGILLLSLALLAVVSPTSVAGDSYVAASSTVYYTTASTETYLCPSSLASGKAVVCGIAQYPAGNNEGSSTTITCPSGTLISCFLFASFGEVGGACPATTADTGLKENPMENSWLPLPTTVAPSCVGQQSCTLTLGVTASSGLATVNGVETSLEDLMNAGSKLKVLAVCSGTGVGSSSASTTSVSASISDGGSVTTTTTGGASSLSSVVCSSVITLLVAVVMMW